MSQEYTEDKDITLTRLSNRSRLYEALLLLISLFAIYLMVALLSFNPSDPSWSQTAWHEPIHNLAGAPGAWLADTLFFIFGIMAYTVPVIIFGGCWFAWQRRENDDYIDYFALSLRLIGALAIIVTSCGLAAINADDIWYFASGGVIGSLLSTAMMPLLNSSGGTIALLCVWAAGLTLFTGWSWVNIAEKIGGAVLSVLTFASNRTRRDNTWRDEEDDEAPSAHPSRFKKVLRRRHAAEKFSNPVGRHTDDALFSGRRMDDEPQIFANGQAVDPDDVLFSSQRVTEERQDYNDPLLNGTSIATVSIAEPAMGAEWSEEIAAQAIIADPNITVPLPEAETPAVQWEPMPEATTAEPALAPQAEGIPQQQPYASDALTHSVVPVSENNGPGLHASEAPYAESGYENLPAHGREHDMTAPASSSSEAISTLELENVADGRAEIDHSSFPQWEAEQAPLPRETAQPGGEYSLSPSAPSDDAIASASTTALPFGDSAASYGLATASAIPGAGQVAPTAAPIFDLATEAPRAQVKEGIGPQLPRPNRVRVPTRRELASYGIKLPSQREAEERARAEALQKQSHAYHSIAEDDEAAQALQQDELARQFENTQRERYGAAYENEQSVYGNAEPAEDEEPAEQAELARQFAASQQQRYGNDYQHEVTQPPAMQPQGNYPQQAPQVPVAPHLAQPQNNYPQQAPQAPVAPHAGQPQGNYPQHAPQAPVAPHMAQPQGNYPQQAPQAPVAPHMAQPQGNYPQQAPQAPVAPHMAQPQGNYPQHAPQAPTQQSAAQQESLIHPFLMRNGDHRPLAKPSTPLPTLDLLTAPPSEVEPVDTFALEQMARLVEARLADFRIKADVVNYSPGPVITRFELNLAPGVKAARISNLSRDLARSLSTVAVRVVEVIPGKPYVGLELPNKKRQTVYLREVLDCQKFRDSASPLTVVLGKDIAGDPIVADLQKMPHLLVAGTTGSGKSVGVNAMILSMLYKATPEEVRFIMIDPKMLELSVYEGIPHLLTEVVTDMKDAANALRWSVNEMERRYKLMSALGVRNLAGYNERIIQAERMGRPIPDPFWKPGDSMDTTHPVLEKLPYIVVMVDEFADLMMTVGKKVEELIARLAQKARAAGIHLVLATQRPSVDVITGLIKANIPTRIAFTVSSKIDSRTILDQGGAESLLGMGDMLYSGPNSTLPVRVHGAFVRDEEVHAVVQDWKARGRPQYIEGITSDEGGESGAGGIDGDEELDQLFDQAVAFVVEKRKASISGVQRQFRIGYNRAARIVEQMEAQGIVSPQGHNGNREVLAPPPFE